MIKTGKTDLENGYTPYSWKGVNYDIGLDCKEIAKLIRKELKRLYPKFKFSITSKHNYLSVYMTQTPRQPFEDNKNIDFDLLSMRHPYNSTPEELKTQLDNYRTGIYSGYSVNQYHIESSYMLTPESKEIFTKIKELLDSFNYDDSDSMTDYFNTKFYMDLGIGKWNKTLIIIQ